MIGVQATPKDGKAGISGYMGRNGDAESLRYREPDVSIGRDGIHLPYSEVTARSIVTPFEEEHQFGANGCVGSHEVSSHPLRTEPGDVMDAASEGVTEVMRESKVPQGGSPMKRFFVWYWSRLSGFDQSLSVYGFSPSYDQLIAFVFTSFTLVVLGLIEHYGIHPLLNNTLSVFLPAFGATCTVLYSAPKAPIAQPRNVIIAHVTAAVIGIALTNAFRPVKLQPFGRYCAGAIGVALHLVLMMITNTLHPPASATVISAATVRINTYYNDEGFLFVITPVLFGAVFTTACAWLLNNLVASHSPYPQYW